MAEILDAMEEEIVNEKTFLIWDDIKDNDKNIFVTKHRTHFRKIRNGKRVIGKSDGPIGIDDLLLWI